MLWGFYGRVSSAEQTLNNSLPTQREACHQRAIERGATEVLDFIDAGVPGDLDWTDRPALSRMLDMVEKDLLAGVVVYDPDRLARNLGVQLAVTEIMTKHNVKLEFITQDFNASPEGMLFYQIRGAVSQFERAKIRERTNRGRKKVLRSGKPANRVWTYGLVYDRPSDTWSLDEEKAAVIRRMFAWAVEGRGPLWIADRLNEGGVEPPGAPNSLLWWQGTVHRMLRHKAYIGKFYVHRYNYEGHRKNRFLPKERRVKVQERPEEEWVEIAVPAIVDQDTWDAAQTALEKNRQKYPGRKAASYEYLASHLARCGLCGCRMHAATGNKGTKPTPYYRCWGRYGQLKNGCTMPHLKAVDLDAEIWREIRDWLIQPNLYREIATRAISDLPSGSFAAPEEVRTRVEEVRADINRLEELVQRGVVKEVEVRGALRNLREREANLVAQMRGPEPTILEYDPLSPDVVDQFTAVERKEHIRRVLSEIMLFPDGRVELVPRVLQR